MRRIARFGKFAAVAGIGLGSLALAAGPAFAAGTGSTSFGTDASTNVSATLNPGVLNVAAPSSLSYTGSLVGAQNLHLNAEADLYVNDETGSGAGWNITVASSALQSTDAAGASSASPLTIPSNWTVTLNNDSTSPTAATAISMSEVNPSGADYTDPTGNAAVIPLDIPGVHGATSPVPAVVYSANKASGLGDFELNTQVWQNIPANALAGSYTSVLTWTAVSGPQA